MEAAPGTAGRADSPHTHTPARARLTGRRGLLKRIEFLGKKTFLTWHKAAQAAGKSQPIQGWAPGAVPSCRGLAASGCCSTWRFCSSPLKAGLLMDPDQALWHRFSLPSPRAAPNLRLLTLRDLTAKTHRISEVGFAGRTGDNPKQWVRFVSSYPGDARTVLCHHVPQCTAGTSLSTTAWQHTGFTLKESQSVLGLPADCLGSAGGISFILPEMTQTAWGWSVCSVRWGWGKRACPLSLERRWLQGDPAAAHHHLQQRYPENRLFTVVGGQEAAGITEKKRGPDMM